MARLKYEFRHLGLDTGAGYDPAWVDLTAFVLKGNDVSFSFKLNADLETEKGITSSLAVFADAAIYIKNWLIDHASASVNSVLIRITDTLCDTTRGEWLVKTDSLQWCDGGICEYRLTLREYDAPLDCLKSTLITDNHRNWFPEDGQPGGKYDYIDGANNPPYIHPRFRYVDDIKPQALQNFLFVIAQGILIAVNTIVGPILLILNAIDAILDFLGMGSDVTSGGLESLLDDLYDSIFGAFLGANRTHPSPLVRSYFINACSKCLTHSGQRVVFSSTILNAAASDYYNLCHLFAPVKKGVGKDSTKDWIPDNEPIYTAWTYARSLRKIFNAKYRLRDGVFYFERKDFFDVAPILNFTGADKEWLLGKICYRWSGETKPAYQAFKYAQDSFDTDGNEALHRFNDVAEWNAANNPVLTGEDVVLVTDYSGQRYTNDGIDKRLLFNVMGKKLEILDGVLLMSADITSVGKLIIWDVYNTTAKDAQAIRVDYGGGYNISTWQDDYVYSNSTSGYYIYNWPMYYDPLNNDTYKNLYEFHKIDNPNLASVKNIEWELRLELCCGLVDMLMFEAGNYTEINAKVDYLVILSATQTGIITEIEISYETGEIRLKGKIK